MAEGLFIKNLEKSWPGGFTLRIDELFVAPGETLVLAGPSGCGKTTALGIIAGFVREDRGKILLDEEDAAGLPPWKRGISVVFQDLALFPHLSVGGNIGYGPFLRGIKPAERQRIIAEALRTVRLPGYEKRRVDTLSGGERQRVALARALAATPRLLLLDEPFSSLDAPLRREIQGEFAAIRARSSTGGPPPPCIFVTHDREEAALLGDRIALMDQGRIVETGTGRDLFLQPKTAFAGRFFGRGAVLPCEKLSLPGHGLVFIPRDAIRGPVPNTAPADAPGTGRGTLSFKAYFRRASFEGGVVNLELELENSERLGERISARLSAEQPIRAALPEKDKLYTWELDRELIRFVE